MRTYILDKDNKPIPTTSVLAWAYWREANKDKIQVAIDRIGAVTVSTVFLGLDHSFTMTGPPIIFETMIFEGEHDQYQTRCSTWEQALAMHAKAVKLVKGEKDELRANN